MTTRILLAEDLRIVREGVRRILAPREDLEVIAEAENGDEAVRLAIETKPDVAILEIVLPGLSGISAIERIGKESPRTRCIVLSYRQGRAWLEQALNAGAVGYVPKAAGSDELLRAIETVAAGRFYLSPVISEYMVEGLRKPEQPLCSKLSLLTPREREVLQLIAEGLSSKEIASRLGVSPKTADTHRAGLMEKVGIHKSASLVRFAIREGLVAP